MSAAETSTADAGRKASGSSFYAAMRILPKTQRAAMYEIYAFCRAVDDIADDPGPLAGRKEQLQQWRSDVRALYDGAAPPQLRGLQTAIQNFDLRQDDFLAIIDGMEMDAGGPIRAPQWSVLDLYCDRVASAVGRLSVRVFGIAGDAGLALAHHLGRALQLTNILRDLDEDAGVGRLYLPSEALREAGISATDPDDGLVRSGARARVRGRGQKGARSFPGGRQDHGPMSAPQCPRAQHHVASL